MQISCLFGRESYVAGGVVVVRLRLHNDHIRRDCILLAQASGYINLDPKWVKATDSTSSYFLQTPEAPFDQNVTMPQANVANAHCIFITPREVLSMSQVTADGVFLMFNIPTNLIPSYRGLSGTVIYSIVLTLQIQGNTVKELRFPFTVLGSGSDIAPHKIQFSSLVIFGAVSVPTENSLLPQFVNDSEDESESNGHSYLNKGSPAYTSLNGVVYNIRDKDFICALSIKSQREILNPGTSITISLQFEGSIQPCRSVRAYLQQCENRINGSRVQDKIIVEAIRSAINAEHIYLQLHIPSSLTCSFSCPSLKVCYFVVLEFYLDNFDDSASKLRNDKKTSADFEIIKKLRNDGNSDKHYNRRQLKDTDDCEPFTWNLPVEINPHRYPLDVAAEVSTCLDPVAEYVQAFW